MTGKPLKFFLSVLVAIAVWPVSATAQESIVDIRFDWSTYELLAPGSDNWPLTWCEDGHQYTSWGDGGGFGGTNEDGRVSLGFARLEGDYATFRKYNVWGGKNAENPAQFDGKIESMLCLNGNLYAWLSPKSGTGGFDWKRIIRSTDKGAHWQKGVFPNSELVGDCVGCPGLPFFINYGQNYRANADGYVYIYTIRVSNPKNWEVQKPGVTWLARAPASGEAFTDKANWEWYTGPGPTWGAQEDRAPVLEDADGFMRSSAMYIPGLDRFVMVTNHTARNQGNIAVWEAPNPWGPWNLIWKKFGWPAEQTGVVEPTFAFGGFSPKWLSADGRDCVFVWFRPDAWNSVSCRFLTEGANDDTPPPAPTELSAVPISASRIDLSWSAVSDPESGINHYNVYRDGVRVAEPQSPSFSDTGLQPNTTYDYEVSAVNGDGLEGPRSNPTSATTNAATEALISNLVVQSGNNYVVLEGNLSEGARQYVDRAYILVSVPDDLAGLTFIQTAYEDQDADPGSIDFLSFVVSQPVTVFVAHDDRLARPAWLSSDFTDTELNLENSEEGMTFSVFRKTFAEGEVVLGSNSDARTASSSMYSVIVEPNVSIRAVPPAAPTNLRIVPSDGRRPGQKPVPLRHPGRSHRHP